MRIMTIRLLTIAWRERNRRKACLQKHRAIEAELHVRQSAAG